MTNITAILDNDDDYDDSSEECIVIMSNCTLSKEKYHSYPFTPVYMFHFYYIGHYM